MSAAANRSFFRGVFMHWRSRFSGPVGLAALFVAAVLLTLPGIALPLTDNDEVRESVVRVEVDKGNAIMQGTGFIINDNRNVVTNHHVIENAKTIYLTFLAAGKPMAVPARVILD